jgi:hypothetical protein
LAIRDSIVSLSDSAPTSTSEAVRITESFVDITYCSAATDVMVISTVSATVRPKPAASLLPKVRPAIIVRPPQG